MYIDSSAIVAILADSKEAGYMIAKIEQSGKVYSSSITLWDAAMQLAHRLTKRDSAGNSPSQADIESAHQFVNEFADVIKLREVTVSGKSHKAALEAAARYGLDISECFAYAMTKEYRLPLLACDSPLMQTDLTLA